MLISQLGVQFVTFQQTVNFIVPHLYFVRVTIVNKTFVYMHKMKRNERVMIIYHLHYIT